MKIIAINGSARKNWNTHLLLNKAIEGAKEEGAQTKLIHLYDVGYTGCTGCLGCKVKGNKNLGHCIINDGLKAVLEEVENSDGLLLGSPIYFGDITAMMRAFLERLSFQYLNYDDDAKPFYTGNLKTAFIYTMNVSEGFYTPLFEKYEAFLNRNFNYVGTVESAETLQIADYNKYHLASFNEQERKDRREKNFPLDCKKAFDLGKVLAKA